MYITVEPAFFGSLTKTGGGFMRCGGCGSCNKSLLLRKKCARMARLIRRLYGALVSGVGGDFATKGPQRINFKHDFAAALFSSNRVSWLCSIVVLGGVQVANYARAGVSRLFDISFLRYPLPVWVAAGSCQCVNGDDTTGGVTATPGRSHTGLGGASEVLSEHLGRWPYHKIGRYFSNAVNDVDVLPAWHLLNVAGGLRPGDIEPPWSDWESLAAWGQVYLVDREPTRLTAEIYDLSAACLALGRVVFHHDFSMLAALRDTQRRLHVSWERFAQDSAAL